jgi:hypothetical protein
MTAASTVRDYYEALRRGEPLEPFFVETDRTWKGAISTRYEGYGAVAAALREQTRTTDDWTVESAALRVHERETFATFADRVRLAWTGTDDGRRREFDTRWSGTLVPVGDDENGSDDAERDWAFETMHVSAPREV